MYQLNDNIFVYFQLTIKHLQSY